MLSCLHFPFLLAVTKNLASCSHIIHASAILDSTYGTGSYCCFGKGTYDLLPAKTLFDRDLKALSPDDEERGNFAFAAGWSANKIFKGLGKIVGHDNSNKMKTKFGDFLFGLLRKKGKTAEDAFALARKQTDPTKRAKFEAVAKMYETYLKKPL